MIKTLSAIVLLTSSIYAQITFDEFLNDAIKNSPYLKKNALNITQTTLENEVLQRTKNPTLELEYSRFEPDANGYKIAFSQNFKGWGVADDIKKFTSVKLQKIEAKYNLSYAQFQQNISLLFVQYAQKQKLYTLAKEELEIASRIYAISQKRYDVGTISQGVMFQAKVEFDIVSIELDSLYLDSQKEYFALFEIAGYSAPIALDYHYDFIIQNNIKSLQNPSLTYLENLEDEQQVFSKLQAHTIESFDIYTSFEHENKQEIVSVGVSFDLPIFNTKKQEIEVAKLERDKVRLEIQKKQKSITLKLLELKQERVSLYALEVKNRVALTTQEKLLQMFEKSYKIARVNLLELQTIKNRVIQTKKTLIKLHSLLDINTINRNYLQGFYNE